MNKRLLAVTLLLMLLLVSVPAWGLTFLDRSSTLGSSDWRTEERWLEEGILGLRYDSPSISYITKVEFSDSMQSPGLTNFDPETPWSYVIIKYANTWEAYRNDGESYLTVGPFAHDISHVTFFRNGVQVPEPATMIMLGLGLLGLGIATRRKR